MRPCRTAYMKMDPMRICTISVLIERLCRCIENLWTHTTYRLAVSHAHQLRWMYHSTHLRCVCVPGGKCVAPRWKAVAYQVWSRRDSAASYAAENSGTPLPYQITKATLPIRVYKIGMTGFEPATICSQSTCATKLRYIPFKWMGLDVKIAAYK